MQSVHRHVLAVTPGTEQLVTNGVQYGAGVERQLHTRQVQIVGAVVQQAAHPNVSTARLRQATERVIYGVQNQIGVETQMTTRKVHVVQTVKGTPLQNQRLPRQPTLPNPNRTKQLRNQHQLVMIAVSFFDSVLFIWYTSLYCLVRFPCSSVILIYSYLVKKPTT